MVHEVDTSYGLKHGIFESFYYFLGPTQRIYWLYLLSALAIAFFGFLFVKSKTSKSISEFLKATFPKSVYLHKSAINDYLFFIINRILIVFLLSPLLLFGASVSNFVFQTLKNHLSISQIAIPSGWISTLLFTFVVVVVSDFSIYLSHFIQHKIPFFWQFHKVHHSAQVMTPITVYRTHPIDDILTVTIASFSAGLFDGFLHAFVASSLKPFTILGLNVFVFVYYLVGYNLRHSHVWISYGPFWNRVFISPAQHQIHHSTAPEHWDKNLGFIFSFWDALFGSLVVPLKKMDLQFGIGKNEEKEFSNVLKFYFLPFKKYIGVLKKRYSKP